MAHQLDARGLRCPMPILKARQALKPLSAGEILHVICTDPTSVDDFKAFAKQTGHELLKCSELNGEFHFSLKKA